MVRDALLTCELSADSSLSCSAVASIMALECTLRPRSQVHPSPLLSSRSPHPSLHANCVAFALKRCLYLRFQALPPLSPSSSPLTSLSATLLQARLVSVLSRAIRHCLELPDALLKLLALSSTSRCSPSPSGAYQTISRHLYPPKQRPKPSKQYSNESSSAERPDAVWAALLTCSCLAYS